MWEVYFSCLKMAGIGGLLSIPVVTPCISVLGWHNQSPPTP